MIYEFDYTLTALTEPVEMGTYVNMAGEDARKNEHTSYTKYLITFVRYDDEYHIDVFPVAKDGSSEYDVPLLDYFAEDKERALNIYHTMVYRALDGKLEKYPLL